MFFALNKVKNWPKRPYNWGVPPSPLNVCLIYKLFETIVATNIETLFETNTNTLFPQHQFFFRPIILKQIPGLFFRSISKNMKKSCYREVSGRDVGIWHSEQDDWRSVFLFSQKRTVRSTAIGRIHTRGSQPVGQTLSTIMVGYHQIAQLIREGGTTGLFFENHVREG